MIDFPNKNELRQLGEVKGPFCLTMYVPFIEQTSGSDANRTQLRNFIKEAEAALESAGAGEDEMKKVLAPLWQLLDSHATWPPIHASLAIFSGTDYARVYHLPENSTESMVQVGPGFKLSPLEKMMADNHEYFVLALGHKNVQFYKGDYYQLHPAGLQGFPMDMKETLNIDEYPNWRETHTIAPVGKNSEASHSQYDVSQTDKIMLKEFFRHIEHQLYKYLEFYKLPLIIAGVDYLLPMYRLVNRYPGLVDEVIKGNQEKTTMDSIRHRAVEIIKKQAGSND